MTYLQRLNPWCIIRPFPNMRTLIVGRFRRRVDAVCVSEARRSLAWCEAAWDTCESSSK